MGEIQDPFADQWDASTSGIETSPYLGPSTGENNVPATASNTHNWLTPANIATLALGNSSFTSSGGSYIFPYLRGSNFGFSIPATATILGIEASVIWAATSDHYTLADLKLAWGASAVNLSTTNKAAGENIGGDGGEVTFYGGESDLWGETTATLTPTVINSTDFGFVLKPAKASALSSAVSIDAFRVRVFYSEATPDGAVRITQVEALVLAKETKPVRITQVYAEVVMSVNSPSVAGGGGQQTVIVAG